jgi:hypothetical protein
MAVVTSSPDPSHPPADDVREQRLGIRSSACEHVGGGLVRELMEDPAA